MGKKKCKRSLDINLESLDDMSVLPLVLEEPLVRSTDDRIDTLVGVVTDLVLRVDSTQRQLDTLQLTLSTPAPADDMARYCGSHTEMFSGRRTRVMLVCQ
jgi:hypothetical protein